MSIKKHLVGMFLVFCVVFFVSGTFAKSQERFNEDLLKGFTYRNLGPFRTGGWISDFAVPAPVSSPFANSKWTALMLSQRSVDALTRGDSSAACA